MATTLTKQYAITQDGLRELQAGVNDGASEQLLKIVNAMIKVQLMNGLNDVIGTIQPSYNQDHVLTTFAINLTLPAKIAITDTVVKYLESFINQDFVNKWHTNDNQLFFISTTPLEIAKPANRENN